MSLLLYKDPWSHHNQTETSIKSSIVLYNFSSLLIESTYVTFTSNSSFCHRKRVGTSNTHVNFSLALFRKIVPLIFDVNPTYHQKL